MLPYVIPVLIAVTMFIHLVKDWKQHHQIGRWVLVPVIMLLVAANVFQTWKSGESRKSELENAQKSASVQTTLLKQMQTKNQDLEARIIAQDERTRALTACIPDASARRQAQAIGPKFTRQAEANIGIRAGATAKVTKANK